MIYNRYGGQLQDWQLYWPRWYKIKPWATFYPPDEDRPAELWMGIGPIQTRWYMWGVYKSK